VELRVRRLFLKDVDPGEGVLLAVHKDAGKGKKGRGCCSSLRSSQLRRAGDSFTPDRPCLAGRVNACAMPGLCAEQVTDPDSLLRR
jgi:hypothetical protein